MNEDPKSATTNPVEVLYQDEHLVAVNKPAGLLVHRSRIDVHATEFALQKVRDQIGQPVFLLHRLDRPTSGVLLFALSSKIARQISDQFAQRTVTKFYRAIVRGHLDDRGRWEEDLLEKLDAISDAKANTKKAPQTAITEFETMRRWEVPISAGKYQNSRYSEVLIKPLTGRKHQIRRHFNHMSHPIIGDTNHGDNRHNQLFREQFQIHRLLLVAHRIEFMHPTSRESILITAPVGNQYQSAIEQLDSNAISSG